MLLSPSIRPVLNHGSKAMQHDSPSDDSASLTAWLNTLPTLADEPASPADLLAAATSCAEPFLPDRRVASRSSRALPLEHAVNAIDCRHRVFIEVMPDAVTVQDDRGHFIDANPAACRLLGYRRDEMLRMSVIDISPSMPVDQVDHVLASIRRGNTFAIETTVLCANGKPFPVEIHCNVYREGDATRVVSVLRRITHWQQTANGLRDAEQRHRVLLHSMDKGVVIRSAEGPVVYVNPAAKRIFGWGGSELSQIERDGHVGWHPYDTAGNEIAHDDLPAQRALRLGISVESETICFRLPGLDPLWVVSTAVPLFRNGEDKAYQVVCTFTDVTELKRTRDLLEQTQGIACIGGYELAIDTRRLTCTEEMYRLFDLPNDIPMTMDLVLSMLVPESRARLLFDLEEAGRGVSAHHEYEIVTALGRRRWIAAGTRPLLLGGRVHAIGGMCQDITDRKLLEGELRARAVTDLVTDLPNRETILDALRRQVVATRDGEGPSLLYVDLDRFKTINDILGAAAGDSLLGSAARRLRDCLPEGAEIGRFAGDEFLVVLPRAMREGQQDEVAEMINAKFRRPFKLGNEEFVITASIGVARHPEGGRTVEELLRHADAAMTKAKQRGRNTWQAFSSAIARRLEYGLTLQTQLRHALDNHELRLAYQPQVNLADGRLVAVEALLRWDHPQRGELHPLAFLQHAENSGDIVVIGAWVIEEACRQLREWRDVGLEIDRVAVNVSYRQLLSESFLHAVTASLRRHRLAGKSLELEMIERMLIEDTPDTVQMFNDLRALGITIMIDDFGEGYSALNYLRRLPVDGFKISYDFMRRVPANDADAAICEAIIRIGHGLRLGMVAEGVETEEQRSFLLHHGMTLGQGHLFSPALRAEHVVGFARSRLPAGAH